MIHTPSLYSAPVYPSDKELGFESVPASSGSARYAVLFFR